MDLKCFSLVDFEKSGGATVRISGILNALSNKGTNVKFFSSNSSINELDDNVDIIQLNILTKFTKRDKRIFQFLLAYFPIFVVNFFFKQKLSYFNQLFKKDDKILFFEYLDISIAYWLFKNKTIRSYYTDVHGVAPLEFELNETKSTVSKFSNFMKKVTAIKLDKKIYKNSSLVIYPSKGLQNYMNLKYNINNKNTIVLSESINENIVKQEIDVDLQTSLIDRFNVSDKDAVILFAGAFKALGGIVDLVKAYIKLRNENEINSCLILVGDGPLYEYCETIINNSLYSDEIHLLGRQPYNKLRTFQSISDIIVCPDKDTKYSQILPHIKYFDSLVSGKIVINGDFEFTEDLNPNQFYSLDFQPSNIESLKETILYAINNFESLKQKYSKSSEIAIQKFSYEKNITSLINYLDQQILLSENFKND